MNLKGKNDMTELELLQEKIKTKVIGCSGEYVQISLQELRECCDCEDKYKQFNHFKTRVLDTSCKEINSLTLFRVKYTYVKHGKTIVAIVFHVNMSYHNGNEEQNDTYKLWV